MTTERSRYLAAHLGSPANGRSSRASGLSWSATRATQPLPNHLPRRRPSPSRCLRWPSTACASLDRQVPTRAADEPAVDTAGDHADPGPPSHAAACPPPPVTTSLRSDTADAGSHGHRTPRLDAGHLDARTPAPGTGQRRVDRHAWTLDARTGRRTLAEDTDTVTKARPASGPPGPPPPAAARWATNRVAADSAAALGNHDGSAVATPPAQDRLLHYQPAARSLRRPSRAPAHCSPRTMSGRA